MMQDEGMQEQQGMDAGGQDPAGDKGGAKEEVLSALKTVMMFVQSRNDPKLMQLFQSLIQGIQGAGEGKPQDGGMEAQTPNPSAPPRSASRAIPSNANAGAQPVI